MSIALSREHLMRMPGVRNVRTRCGVYRYSTVIDTVKRYDVYVSVSIK